MALRAEGYKEEGIQTAFKSHGALEPPRMEDPADALRGDGGEARETPPVESRDDALLDIIRKERLGQFSFDGIRRRSGFHQETLSRALDRLEDQGFLSRSNHGYSVVRPLGDPIGSRDGSATAQVPLMQTLLPDDVSIPDVVAALKGRWFGTLRWLGMTSEGEKTILKWINEDGGIQVDAAFSPGLLEVAACIKEGRRLADALKGSYDLLGHLTRAYTRLNAKRLVSYLDFRDLGATSN